MIKNILMVGIGGFAGSILRYVISSVMIGSGHFAFPLGTCTVNVIGSLLIGIMLATLNGGTWFYICVIGFCGGFTTFSTFSAELFQMVRSQHYAMAFGYMAISVIVCLAAVGIGIYLGEKLNLKL